MLEADLDAWYEELKEHTYRSVFLPLSVSEARAMMAVYDARMKGAEAPADALSLISELEGKVESSLKELNSEAVFVKLSSRSPKDATNRVSIKHQLIRDILEKEALTTTEGEGEGEGKLSENAIVRGIFQAHISSFKVTSAKEVLETLLHSDRVITDELPLVLEHKDVQWKEHIVLREWVDIPIQYEFRGFVYDNRLTALCQYYDEVLYTDLVTNKDKIQSLVLNFFEKIKDDVPITPKEYVLDFLVDVREERVRIVEINPFGKPDGMGTGTVMFDLKKPEDVSVLFGDSPFEFRVETEALGKESYSKMIGPKIKEIVKKFEKD